MGEGRRRRGRWRPRSVGGDVSLSMDKEIKVELCTYEESRARVSDRANVGRSSRTHLQRERSTSLENSRVSGTIPVATTRVDSGSSVGNDGRVALSLGEREPVWRSGASSGNPLRVAAHLAVDSGHGQKAVVTGAVAARAAGVWVGVVDTIRHRDCRDGWSVLTLCQSWRSGDGGFRSLGGGGDGPGRLSAEYHGDSDDPMALPCSYRGYQSQQWHIDR